MIIITGYLPVIIFDENPTFHNVIFFYKILLFISWEFPSDLVQEATIHSCSMLLFFDGI